MTGRQLADHTACRGDDCLWFPCCAVPMSAGCSPSCCGNHFLPSLDPLRYGQSIPTMTLILG